MEGLGKINNMNESLSNKENTEIILSPEFGKTNEYEIEKISSDIKKEQNIIEHTTNEVDRIRKELGLDGVESNIPSVDVNKIKKTKFENMLNTVSSNAKIAALSAGLFVGGSNLEAKNQQNVFNDKNIQNIENSNKANESLDKTKAVNREEEIIKYKKNIQKYLNEMASYKKDTAQWNKAYKAYNDSLALYNNSISIRKALGDKYLSVSDDDWNEKIGLVSKLTGLKMSDDEREKYLKDEYSVEQSGGFGYDALKRNAINHPDIMGTKKINENMYQIKDANSLVDYPEVPPMLIHEIIEPKAITMAAGDRQLGLTETKDRPYIIDENTPYSVINDILDDGKDMPGTKKFNNQKEWEDFRKEADGIYPLRKMHRAISETTGLSPFTENYTFWDYSNVKPKKEIGPKPKEPLKPKKPEIHPPLKDEEVVEKDFLRINDIDKKETPEIKIDPKYKDLRMRSLWPTILKQDISEKIGTLHPLDSSFENGFTIDEAMSFPQEIKNKYNIDYIYNQIHKGHIEESKENYKHPGWDYNNPTK